MRLSVGITHLTPAWKILLEQIAPPCEELNSTIDWSTENYGCIIVSSTVNVSVKEKLKRYLTDGGSLLLETEAAKQILGTNSEPAFVDYIDTTNDSLFSSVASGSVGRKLNLPSKATQLKERHGRYLVEGTAVGKGYVIILPGGMIDSILSWGCTRRSFPSHGPLLPSERVAKVSKRTIRDIVNRSLQELFWRRDLPFVSLSPFPDGEDLLFSFRVDTDFASQKAVETLYELCKKHDVPATWFVETGSCQEWVDRYGKMEGHEIGLHCFKHRTFNNYTKNELDMRTGTSILRKNGITPRGYAAPFGEWNTTLAKALEHRGFEYSSEFALDYDNLPFYPFLGERSSFVMQIPIHPISTGTLRNAHHSTEEMKDYFEIIMEDHLADRLPLFIYDHPTNPDHETLDWLFQTVKDRKIPAMTMGQYADWWKIRTETHWSARLENGRLQLSSSNLDDSVKIEVFQSDERHTIAEKNSDLELSKTVWRTTEAKTNRQSHISILHQLNRKMIFNDILHTYWKYKL